MPEPTTRCPDTPTWIHLDTIARIGRCVNATTARAMTSTGCLVELSFETAAPPGISRCSVHFPDLTLGLGDNSWASGRVTGADGSFLLVRVIFPDPEDDCMATDLFVYTATPPCLRLLPRPYPTHLRSNHVGVLACRDGGVAGEHYCLVVIPERRIEAPGAPMFYHLQIFSTKTNTWSTKVARLVTAAWYWFSFEPTKVFSIGGSSLAWVDLRYSILLCNDVLEEDPEMRMIQLPPLTPDNKLNFGKTLCGVMPHLDVIRDVAFRDGWFRFIEIEYPRLGEDDLTQLGWRASIFKMMICSEDWELCHTIDSAELTPVDSCLPCLFPEMWDYEKKKLTLNKVASSTPTLDMYRDDVLYMITKLKADDPNGWVLAVDTRNNILEKVVPFASETLYLSRAYLQCVFSK